MLFQQFLWVCFTTPPNSPIWLISEAKIELKGVSFWGHYKYSKKSDRGTKTILGEDYEKTLKRLAEHAEKCIDVNGVYIQ